MKKMKRYEDGGEIDALEAANQSEESQKIDNEARGEAILKAMRDKESAPKPKPKTTVKATSEKPESSGVTRISKEAGEAAQAKFRESSKPDVTKMSVSERMKASRESARLGSGKTDTRSVSERLRSAFGMAKGGSASSRADGIAQKGKTKGRMC